MKISKYCGTCKSLKPDLNRIINGAIQNKCQKNSKHFDSFNILQRCNEYEIIKQYEKKK